MFIQANYGKMLEERLKFIFNQFLHKAKFDSYEEFKTGHINDTYLIKTKKKPYFILQKINHNVFKEVASLVKNKINISTHLQKKFAHLSKQELHRRVLSFVYTKNGEAYYKENDGSYWNMTLFIEDSLTFDKVSSEEIAYEGGKLFGEFLNMTSDFEASKLIEVIPRFHDMSFRYSQFEEAIKIASKDRLFHAEKYIDLIKKSKAEMHIIQNLKDSGKIKLRVTHNDTKISNALFDLNNKGLCVIDTDTIMPGIIHYDFGDAIRTICNSATEDETELDLVNFNLKYYKAYVKGFLETIGDSLTPIELKYLPLGAKSTIFIMALRFLTDYLNGDIYYKTNYPEHNFDRAKNQFKLIESLNENYIEMQVNDNNL